MAHDNAEHSDKTLQAGKADGKVEKWKPVRCPICKRIGSSRLGNYCKDHYKPEFVKMEEKPKAKDDFDLDIRRDTFYPTTGYHQGEFTQGKFGVMKDTFGVEEH